MQHLESSMHLKQTSGRRLITETWLLSRSSLSLSLQSSDPANTLASTPPPAQKIHKFLRIQNIQKFDFKIVMFSIFAKRTSLFLFNFFCYLPGASFSYIHSCSLKSTRVPFSFICLSHMLPFYSESGIASKPFEHCFFSRMSRMVRIR